MENRSQGLSRQILFFLLPSRHSVYMVSRETFCVLPTGKQWAAWPFHLAQFTFFSSFIFFFPYSCWLGIVFPNKIFEEKSQFPPLLLYSLVYHTYISDQQMCGGFHYTLDTCPILCGQLLGALQFSSVLTLSTYHQMA